MKNKLRLKTIGGKIILSIVIVIAICVLFSAFIVSQVVKDQLGEKYEVDKVAAAESLSYSLAPVLDLYDYKQVERIITSSLTYENIAYITVFDKGGIPIVSAAEQDVSSKDLDVEKYEITSNDKVIGSIEVGFSRKYIDEQIQTTTVALISGLAGFLILVGLALYIFINRSVINPLGAFTKTVREMDSENLSLRVNIHSEDELGTLAGSFNQMTEDLEKSQGSLKKARDELKQWGEELKQTAEEWSTTFDSITDLVSIHDTDFKLVRVNTAFANALKMKPAELIGRTCYQVIHGWKEPWQDCPHMKTLKTKKSTTTEFFEPHLGIHLEVSTSPIFNKKGEVVASVHVTRDITERKKMEEQLIVTDRLASVGELASGIAHEMNNPLTTVVGFSQLLLKKDLPDDVRERLELVNQEAKRCAAVAKNLLTFARKHDTEKHPTNINDVIQSVLELRAYEQRVHNIGINAKLAPNLPEIQADGFQLQQVFINIVINAEHFMYEAHGKGTLTIITERIEDTVRASFADDGPGISREALGHIFDPFFTTKEVGKGTGLGLSISHGIIAEHGGKLYTESEIGKGATFIIELPIRKKSKGKLAK